MDLGSRCVHTFRTSQHRKSYVQYNMENIVRKIFNCSKKCKNAEGTAAFQGNTTVFIMTVITGKLK